VSLGGGALLVVVASGAELEESVEAMVLLFLGVRGRGGLLRPDRQAAFFIRARRRGGM
jgi:hypothetical protein